MPQSRWRHWLPPRRSARVNGGADSPVPHNRFSAPARARSSRGEHRLQPAVASSSWLDRDLAGVSSQRRPPPRLPVESGGELEDLVLVREHGLSEGATRGSAGILQRMELSRSVPSRVSGSAAVAGIHRAFVNEPFTVEMYGPRSWIGGGVLESVFLIAESKSRTRAASFAGTPTTCSPASRNRWASGRPTPLAAFNSPDPARQGLGVGRASRRSRRWSVAKRPVPRRFSCWSTTSIVADNLWGSTQMTTCSMVLLPPVLVPTRTARWAVLLRAGQSLLEPRLVTVPDGTQTGSRATPAQRVGSRKESVPPDTWARTGYRSFLRESSGSPERRTLQLTCWTSGAELGRNVKKQAMADLHPSRKLRGYESFTCHTRRRAAAAALAETFSVSLSRMRRRARLARRWSSSPGAR